MRCAWPSETRDLRSTSSPRVSADSIWSSPFYTQSGPGISNAATTDRRIGHRRSLISFKHVGLSLPPRSPLPPPLALLLHPWTLIGRVLLASQGAQVVEGRARPETERRKIETPRHREDVVDRPPGRLEQLRPQGNHSPTSQQLGGTRTCPLPAHDRMSCISRRFFSWPTLASPPSSKLGRP